MEYRLDWYAMSSDRSQCHSVVRIFAVTRVLGSTRACEARGDVAMFQALQRYYSLVADAVNSAGGRVIKVMVDGTLLSFPTDSPGSVVEVL